MYSGMPCVRWWCMSVCVWVCVVWFTYLPRYGLGARLLVLRCKRCVARTNWVGSLTASVPAYLLTVLQRGVESLSAYILTAMFPALHAHPGHFAPRLVMSCHVRTVISYHVVSLNVKSSQAAPPPPLPDTQTLALDHEACTLIAYIHRTQYSETWISVLVQVRE